MVHWFQIIRTRSFQMFDDDAQTSITLSARDRFYKVAKFPTRNIKTPILLVYGGSDSLVDINVMLNELPRKTVAKEIPHFEHLDFLWANDVDKLVFPHVLEALEKYAGKERFSDRFSKSPEVDRRKEMLKITDRDDADIGEGDQNRFWTSSAGETGTDNSRSLAIRSPGNKSTKKNKKSTLFQSAFGHTRDHHDSEPNPSKPQTANPNSILPRPSSSPRSLAISSDDSHLDSELDTSPPQQARQFRGRELKSSLSPAQGDIRPHKRNGSVASIRSLQEKSFVQNGIRLGAAKASVGGVT